MAQPWLVFGLVSEPLAWAPSAHKHGSPTSHDTKHNLSQTTDTRDGQEREEGRDSERCDYSYYSYSYSYYYYYYYYHYNY